MYLLDTNICVALLNENRKVMARFNRVFSQCYISTIVLSELYKGVYSSRQIEKNLHSLEQFTELIDIEAFDLNAAVEFGKMSARA